MTPSPAPKVLHVGLLAPVHNFDPLKAQDVDSLFVLRQVVEAPFSPVAGGAGVEPALFDGTLRHEPGSDEYRGRLRPDLRFSDGSAVSIDDVAECLARVALVRDQADVDVEGEEVVFRLRQTNPRFDVTLSHPQCSIHRWQGERLLGTGAYVLADSSTPEEVLLVRNPHHRHDVPIDRVRFHVYPPDEEGRPTALMEAVQGGEVHYTHALGRDDLNSLTGVRKSFRPGISTSMLYLNTQSAALGDRRVRQAVAHAIDRVEVARRSYSNALAFAAAGLLPRSLGTAVDGLTHDLAKARELLAEPGVTKPERLSLLMMWGPRPYLPDPDRYREAIAEQLGELGIEVLPVPTSSSLEFAERLIAGSEDMVLSGWVADVMDAADFLESNLASNRVPTEENIAVSTNNGRLQSVEMDRALADYRSRRTPGSLAEVMRVLTEEAPLVPLAYGPTTAVHAFTVEGFVPSPLSIFPLSRLNLPG